MSSGSQFTEVDITLTKRIPSELKVLKDTDLNPTTQEQLRTNAINTK
jgi:hypothetical protein